LAFAYDLIAKGAVFARRTNKSFLVVRAMPTQSPKNTSKIGGKIVDLACLHQWSLDKHFKGRCREVPRIHGDFVMRAVRQTICSRLTATFFHANLHLFHKDADVELTALKLISIL
jgi:hypothetical protein